MRFCLTATVIVALAASASATVVIPTEFRGLVDDAELIVRGRVTDVRSVEVPRSGVESVATLAVDRVLKGSPQAFVSLRFPGGEIGRYRYVMIGAPQLRAGEQVFCFLRRGADGYWRPIGLTMGVVHVRAEPASGRAVVDPPLLAGVTAPSGRVNRGEPRRHGLSPSEFEGLVRLVQATRARQGTGGR